MTDFMVHELSSLGEHRQIESLIRMGKVSDVNLADEEYGRRTALHLAAAYGHVRCCKILLENGANPVSSMDMGWTPAHCAAENGHLDVLQLLHEQGNCVSSPDIYGDTPKKIAELYGHKECAEFLSKINGGIN